MRSSTATLETPKSAHSSKARHEMIEACDRLCQLLGLPRSVGQIYGFLYMSPKPVSLDDLVEALGISKASASTGTRQLTSWGAIRQVWVPGDRRDFYETIVDLAEFLRSSYLNFVKPRVAASGTRLDSILHGLDDDLQRGAITAEEFKICSDRIRNLVKLQRKLRGILPVAERLM